MSEPARARFVVYTRANCALCDEFIAALAGQLAHSDGRFEVRDVEADPDALRRFGLKIPVLTIDGSVVCHGRLDAAAVARLLAR